MLRSSRLGAEIETRAILAERAGDPAAKAIAGSTTHLPSGQTVINEPGGPPVVYEGRATRQQIDSAPAQPQTDTRPASAVMAAWDQVVQHSTTSGLWVHP